MLYVLVKGVEVKMWVNYFYLFFNFMSVVLNHAQLTP